MSIIEVDRISKRFFLQHDRPRSFQELLLSALRRKNALQRREEFWALRDISFNVEAGQTMALIGSNGSGKSTSLKLLTRIIEPTSGTIKVNGRVSALLELGTGFHPELTGRENVFLNGSLLGLRRREIARRLDEIVAFAELERFIDVPVKFYSSGMYVRLAFAVAINVDPDVLLIDEVLAVGDQNFQAKCLERIHELKAKGITILFVSHALESVRSLCERTLWLKDGLLCEEGDTETVVAHYREYVQQRAEALTGADGSAPSPQPAHPDKAPADAIPFVVGEDQATAQALPATPRADAAQGEDKDLAAQRRRWGTREAEIIEVRFLDRSGNPRALQPVGDALTIALRYRAHKRIAEPVFGISIHRSDGQHIWGTNTFLCEYPIEAIEGEGEVRYSIETLPLPEGYYLLSTALHKAGDTWTYDYQHLYYEFRVFRNVPETTFTIYIPSRWEHRPDSPQEETMP